MLSPSQLLRMWTPAPVSGKSGDGDEGFGLMVSGTSLGAIKVLSDEQRQLEAKEYEETVRKLHEHRGRHDAQKKVWGAVTPNEGAWARSTMAPTRRPSSAKPKLNATGGSFNTTTSSVGTFSRTPRPRSALRSDVDGSGGAGFDVTTLVSQLEQHVDRLQSDVNSMRSGEGRGGGGGGEGGQGLFRWQSSSYSGPRTSTTSRPVVTTRDPANAYPRPAVVVPPAHSSRVNELAADHARNLAILERVLREKSESERRVAELETQLGDTTQPHSVAPVPTPQPAPIASRSAATATATAVKKSTISVASESKLSERSSHQQQRPEEEEEEEEEEESLGGDEALPPGAVPDEGKQADVTEEEEEDKQDEENEDDVAWANRIRAAYLSGGEAVLSSRGSARGVSKSTTALLGTAASLIGSGSRGDRGVGGVSASVRTGRSSSRPITVPQPFTFEDRAKSLPRGIAQLRLAAEQQRREAEEAEFGKAKVFAREVPDSVKQPKFHEMMARAKETSKMNHDARVAMLTDSLAAFQGLLAHEQDMLARKAEKAKAASEAEASAKRAAIFKANAIPPQCQSETMKAESERKEAERKERIERRKAELLACAKMPKRMEEHAQEAKEREKEAAERQKAAELKEKARATSAEKRGPTKSMPFAFDSEERRAAEAAAREARQQRAALRYAAVNPGHPSVQHVVPLLKEKEKEKEKENGGGDKDVSDSSNGARLTRRVQRQNAAGGGGGDGDAVSVATMKTTVAQQARMKIVQDMMQSRLAAEKEKEEAERQRVAKQKQANKEIAALVGQMEKERRPTPLAWQVKADSAEAVALRKRAAKDAREAADRLKAVVNRAVAKRPMLFLRTTVEAQVSQARKSAELNIHQKLKDAGLLTGVNEDDDYGDDAHDDGPTDAELGLE